MWRWVWKIVKWILINLMWTAMWAWVAQWFSKQEELLCGVGYGKLSNGLLLTGFQQQFGAGLNNGLVNNR